MVTFMGKCDRCGSTGVNVVKTLMKGNMCINRSECDNRSSENMKRNNPELYEEVQGYSSEISKGVCHSCGKKIVNHDILSWPPSCWEDDCSERSKCLTHEQHVKLLRLYE